MLVRTYIRVEYVNFQEIMCQLPEIWPDLSFALPIRQVDPNVRGKLHSGFRCCVSVNSDAKLPSDLVVTNWTLY